MLRHKKYRHLWIPICTLAFFIFFAASAWSLPPCNNPIAYRFITTSPLPQATVGQSYLKQFQVVGTVGSVTYVKGDGSLPPGLSLSAGGMISGIPTTTGNYSFEVIAKDNCQGDVIGFSFSGGFFSLIVNQKSCAPLQITSPSALTPATTGLSYSNQIQATGQAPITYEIISGSLPPGLSLGSTGRISGTPTTVGNYNFTVRATDSCSPVPQTTTKAFSLIITCPPISITSTSPLPSGNIGSAYSSQITASGTTPITFTITGGSLPPGLSMSNAGRISGTSKMSGTYTFVVRAQDNCLPTGQTTTKTLSLTMNPAPPPQITSPSSLPPALVGQSYTDAEGREVQLTASGLAPMTYDIISGSLPPGLTISDSGRISGVPTTGDTYSFVVRVRDSRLPTQQAATKTLTIRVDIPISVSGSVTPLAYSAPSDITTTQALTYTFTTTPAGNVTIVSTQGIFQVGGTQIYVNNTQISAGITAGRGMAMETLTILPSVMQKALSIGSSQITYTRSFSNASGTVKVNTSIEIRITTGAAADLMITGMQLYFQNHQPVVTIKRNDPALKTYADINYVGSGVLQGYWEVDGNLLSNVIQTITSGSAITIESPAPPILPTFSSGSHRIRFVVTKPSQNIPFPDISYYVSTEEPKTVEVKKLTPLNLLFPYNNGVVNYAPITFLWATREAGVATYFVEFYLKDKEKTLFSAYTKNPNYSLPETILTTFFSPGKTYLWKVKGFDTVNNVIGESALFTFTMGE